MNAYGRFGSSESCPSVSDLKPSHVASISRRRRGLLLLGLLAVLVLAASAASVALLVSRRNRSGSSAAAGRVPTRAISKTCSVTLYPDLCVSSLMDFPGALAAGERDLVHISLNMTLRRVNAGLYGASAMVGVTMDALSRAAYGDCMELLSVSLDHLSNSLFVVSPSSVTTLSSSRPASMEGGASDEDVLTWLSAALTNQDTCSEGLEEAMDSYVKKEMEAHLKDLSKLLSNSLAIFAASSRSKDFSGIPIQNKRKKRKLLTTDTHDIEFPQWVKKKDRRLLQTPAAEIQADMIVSKDGGNNSYKSIAAAVEAAPENSPRRVIIYIKAGRYDENIKVSRKKTNLMFVGDGKSATIVAGSRSIHDHFTTFKTATFAATGAGFIMKDMTIENTAGPEKHQAVALRVGADHSVVYRCDIVGYQDTLYVHSLRQFYRECDIFGTVDFIFGNAAVVLQKCTLRARKPMAMQKNTITAQGRKDPNQNTGISVHNCRLVAEPELEPVKEAYPTYLGRPWKPYSRVVYMLDYIGDHVHPAGWLEWNGNFALDTLYYGEYMNFGPGAGVGRRVSWPGYRMITLPEEASKFTVSEFIYGSSWLPATGVAFLAGLT